MTDIHKLALKLSDPLEFWTDRLGRILVSHWSIGAVRKVSEVLKKDVESSDVFVKEFIKELGRFPGEGQTANEEYDSGNPIDSTEELTDSDLTRFAQDYIAKFRHQILSWVTYSEDGESAAETEKKEDESDKDFFYRLISKSVKKQQEQSKKLHESLGFFGASSGLFDQYSENQARIGALGAKIRHLSSAPVAEPQHHLNIPDIPENPVYRTNELLQEQAKKFDILRDLMESQAEQAVLLNDQTDLLLKDAARSSAQTKVGIWVAAVGIVLGSLMSGYSIYHSKVSGKQSFSLIERTIDQNEQSIKVQNETLEKLELIGTELKNIRLETEPDDGDVDLSRNDMNIDRSPKSE